MIIFDQAKKIFFSTKINDRSYFSGFGTRRFNIDLTQLGVVVGLRQIHSSKITIYKQGLRRKKEPPQSDGMITLLSHYILTVKTADCLPLLLVDKERGVVGISHQGWRGSLERLGQKMVDGIIKQGGKREKITVAIGPSIGACCYSIDKARYLLFKKEFPYWDKILELRGEDWYLNLALLNYLQLVEMGIRKENIDFFPFCTACDKTRFFSYRREKGKVLGQMISFIVKTA